MSERWYDLTKEQVTSKLNTNTAEGLTKAESSRRLRKYGPNRIYPVPRASFFSYLKHISTDFMSILLIITAAIAAVFEQDTSSLVIIGIVVVNYIAVVFTYVKAQRILEDMGHYALPTAKVMRGGRLYMVKMEQLTAGDVIFVSAGDIVPCDARLIEASALSTLEVNITSSVKTAVKDAEYVGAGILELSEQKNMIFAGSIITGGKGKAVVCNVGGATAIYRLGKNTPIVSHEKLKILSLLKNFCRVWSLVQICLIFLLTGADLIVGAAERGLLSIFITALALAVTAMSELYTAFAYIIISCGIFGAISKYKDINSGALIKNSAKLEVMKDISCLVLPKEGAFSIKQLSVEKVYANGMLREFGERKFAENCSRVLRYAVISTGLYGGNKLVSNNLQNENIYTAEEDAIIAAAEKCALYNVELERNYPIVEHLSAVGDNRFETTLVEFGTTHVVAVRGEAVKVLRQCRYYCEDGRTISLTPEKQSDLMITAELIAKKAYRVMGIASKEHRYNNLNVPSIAQSDLTFEGFLAIREPLLPGVARTISRCAAANIKVIMLCPEESMYNRYIAEAVGIASGNGDILTSAGMSDMKDDLLRADINRYKMYEGLTLAQKRRILRYLHESGEVVGVLGGELDDIILLKEADVGFSQSMTISVKAGASGIDMTSRNMPIYVKTSKESSKSGCEALKFVSDVIVSEGDKNGSGGFNAVVGAVETSKVIYRNLLRMSSYLVTSQLAKIFLVLWSVLTKTQAMTPAQILFCGLIVDFAAVLIIAFERPSPELLARRVDTEEKLSGLITANLKQILFALMWTALTAAMPVAALRFGIVTSAAPLCTMTCVSFLVGQITVLNENLRERSIFHPGIRLNRLYVLVILLLAAFVAICMISPAAGSLFSIVALNRNEWLSALSVPLLMLIIYEVDKLLIKNN